ncbi:replication-relaxation family protein [Candidatus Saccharibacteria bacterium]|nr:replication-relaxation family protein [Candidatus Saccharibacteria bacterium]
MSSAVANGSKSKQTRFSRRQFELLEFIYSYRFVTTKQVQRFLGKPQIQQAQQRLNTLFAKEYIGRRYSSEDKLLGRYASYFLLPAGLELLKGYGDKKALRLMKKDPTASWRFVEHCIAIGDVAADVTRIYKDLFDRLTFETKTDMLKSASSMYDGSDDFEFVTDYYPKPLPDGFLDGWPADPKQQIANCFVEVWHDNVPFWVYRKRIQYFIEYADEDIWKDYFGSDSPPILLVCDSLTLQRRVQRYLRRMYDSLSDDYPFLVTNRQLLAQADSDGAIWTRVDDETTETIRLSGVPDGYIERRR